MKRVVQEVLETKKIWVIEVASKDLFCQLAYRLFWYIDEVVLILLFSCVGWYGQDTSLGQKRREKVVWENWKKKEGKDAKKTEGKDEKNDNGSSGQTSESIKKSEETNKFKESRTYGNTRPN